MNINLCAGFCTDNTLYTHDVTLKSVKKLINEQGIQRKKLISGYALLVKIKKKASIKISQEMRCFRITASKKNYTQFVGTKKNMILQTMIKYSTVTDF